MRLLKIHGCHLLILCLCLASCSNQQEINTGRRYFKTTDSVDIMYIEKGFRGKTPIIFLQGSDGNSFEWQMFSERIKNDFHLILFDRRGCGLSTKNLPSSKLTMQRYIDDIKELLEHLNLEAAVILGWSFGGALASEFTLQNPNLVSKLILVNPLSDSKKLWLGRANATFKNASKVNDTLTLNIIEKVRNDENITLEEEYELIKYHSGIIYDMNKIDSFYNNAPYSYYGYNDSTMSTDWNNLIAQKDIYDNYNNLNRIERISCPTLIITGSHDFIISSEQCEEMSRKIKTSKLEIIEKCGHSPFIEQPEELERLILSFLK